MTAYTADKVIRDMEDDLVFLGRKVKQLKAVVRATDNLHTLIQMALTEGFTNSNRQALAQAIRDYHTVRNQSP